MKVLILSILLSFSQISWAQTEAGFDGINPTTAAEEQLAQDYMHDGRAQRIMDEECAKNKFSDLCTNGESAFRSESLQKLEQMMPIVSTVFSMVVGNLNLSKKTAPAEGSTEPGKENQTDACGYIAQGVEMGSQVMRQLKADKTQENLENSPPKTRQAQSMYALADSHKGLRDTARIQTYGWGATAACYAGMATFGKTMTDANYWIKLGGSVLMGTFYGLKGSYHNKRREQLRELAGKMPNAGDCNPVTETSCFCSEESSMTNDPTNYQKYCIPEQLTRPGGVEGLPCVTASGVADPNCNCKLNNSCITHKVGGVGFKLGANTGQIQGLLNRMQALGNGYYKGNLGEASLNNLAFAKKALKKMKPLSTKGITLNSKQKELAKAMTKLGLPKTLAAKIASTPAKGAPAYVASVSPNLKKPTTDLSPSKKMGYASGRSAKKKRKKTAKYSNPFARKRAQQGNSGGVEVMDEYVLKAQREAEIRKDTSKPIFDIISYRYKTSAWKKFKESFKEETVE